MVLAGVAAALFFASSAITAPPKPGGSVTSPGGRNYAAIPAVDSSGANAYGGWLRVQWKASCSTSPNPTLGNSWYVNYSVVDQFDRPPSTSGTSPPFGAQNISGKLSASGLFETFAFMKPGLTQETFHETVSVTCFNPDLKDPNHPNGMMATTTIGGATFTLFKGPEPSSLVVAVTTSALKGKVAVGATANVTAKVTDQGEAVGSVSLRLALKGSALTVASSPPGLNGFSLAKGASRTFVFKVKGVSIGLETLIATADGKTAAGKAVSGSDSTKLLVGSSASVQVAFPAGAVPVGLAVGKTVDVSVNVTAGNVDLTSVSLGSGLVASNDKVKVTQAAGLSGFALPAGASRTFVFKVQGVTHGDSSLTARVTAASAEGKVFGSAMLAVKGLFTIQGKVNTVTSCTAASCPKKPLGGVSVVALPSGGAVAGFAAGEGQATTGADGNYSVDVPKGSYTLSPALEKYRFVLPTRSVAVAGKDVSGIDFKACPVAGIAASGPAGPCDAPSLLANVKEITKDGIVFNVQGQNWDPQGGPIVISIGGAGVRLNLTAADFVILITLPRWPERTTVAVAQARQNPDGYCWGEVAGRQGTIVATSGTVQGKFAGWVLWSGDPRIQAGQAWCDGDVAFFAKSPHPIVVFGAIPHGPQNFYEPTTLVVYNLTGPGSDSPPISLGSLAPVNINLPRYNTCVRVHLNPNLKLDVASSAGTCT